MRTKSREFEVEGRENVSLLLVSRRLYVFGSRFYVINLAFLYTNFSLLFLIYRHEKLRIIYNKFMKSRFCR